MVESQPSKLLVASSILVSRSKLQSRFLAGFILAACSPAVALSQSPAPAAFEVASIKPYAPGGPRGIEIQPGGKLVMRGVPLQIVIATAYGLPFQSSRLTGGPDWIRTEAYNIEASAGPGAIASGLSQKAYEDRVREILRNLLADRFKLALDRQTKELPVYAIVVGKSGAKLQKAKIEEKDCANIAGPPSPTVIPCHSFIGGMGRGLHAQAVDLADLALFVSNWTDRPVVDKTGLAGLFSIETDGWASMLASAAPASDAKGEHGKLLSNRPSLFEVFEKLGLRLDSQKAPIEMFVVQHVERPSAN